jgi:hypothetical protein
MPKWEKHETWLTQKIWDEKSPDSVPITLTWTPQTLRRSVSLTDYLLFRHHLQEQGHIVGDCGGGTLGHYQTLHWLPVVQTPFARAGTQSWELRRRDPESLSNYSLTTCCSDTICQSRDTELGTEEEGPWVTIKLFTGMASILERIKVIKQYPTSGMYLVWIWILRDVLQNIITYEIMTQIR